MTKEAREKEAKSSVRWTVEFDKVPKPSKVSFQLWEDFVEWLKCQNIMTIVDFESSMKTKHETSEDGKHAKENDENEIHVVKEKR